MKIIPDLENEGSASSCHFRLSLLECPLLSISNNNIHLGTTDEFNYRCTKYPGKLFYFPTKNKTLIKAVIKAR